MSSYQSITLIECNRLQDPSLKQNEDNDTAVRNNHEWSVDLRENMLLNRGDQITIEQTAINSIGNGETQIEFSGRANNTDISDNLAKMEFAYYINNNHQFLMPLPKRDSCVRSLYHNFRWKTIQPDFPSSAFTLRMENNENTLRSPFGKYYGSPFLSRLLTEVQDTTTPTDPQPPFKFNFTYRQHYPTDFIENSILQNIRNNAPSFDRFYVGKDNVSSIYDNENLQIDGVFFTSKWDFKTTETEFKVDRGFSTPEMVCSRLTNDLHELSLYKDFITDDNEFMPPYLSNEGGIKDFDINNFSFNTTDSVSKLIPTGSFVDVYMRNKYYPTSSNKLFLSNTNDYNKTLGRLYGSVHIATNNPYRLKASCEITNGITEEKSFTLAEINGLSRVIDDAFLKQYNYYSGYRDGFKLTENGNFGCCIVIADFLKSKLNETPSKAVRTTPNGNQTTPIIDTNELKQDLYTDFAGNSSATPTGFTTWNSINLIDASAIQYLDLDDGDLIFTNLVANESNFLNIKNTFDLIKRPNNDEVKPALYNNNDDNYKKQLIALMDIGAIQDDTMANTNNTFFFNYNQPNELTSKKYDFVNLLPPPFIQPIITKVEQASATNLNQNQYNNLNYVYNVFPTKKGNIQDNTTTPHVVIKTGGGTGVLPAGSGQSSNEINYNNFVDLQVEGYKSLFCSYPSSTLEKNQSHFSQDGETFFLNQSGLDEKEGYKVKVRTDWTADLDPSLVDMSGRLAGTNKSYKSTEDVIIDGTLTGKEKTSLFSLRNSKGVLYDLNKYGDNSIKSLGLGIVVGYRKTLLSGLSRTKNNHALNLALIAGNWNAYYVNLKNPQRIGEFPQVPERYIQFVDGSSFVDLLSANLEAPLIIQATDNGGLVQPINEDFGIELVYQLATADLIDQILWWNEYPVSTKFPSNYEIYLGYQVNIVGVIQTNWDLLLKATPISNPNIPSTTASNTNSNFNPLLELNTARQKYILLKMVIRGVHNNETQLRIGSFRVSKYSGTESNGNPVPTTLVGDEPEILKDVPFIAFVYKGNRDKNLKIPTPMIMEKFGISKSYGDIQQSLITTTQKRNPQPNLTPQTTKFYNLSDQNYSAYSSYVNIGASLSQFRFDNINTNKINLNNLHTPIYSGQTQYNFNDNIDLTKETPAGVNPPPNPTPETIQQRSRFDEGIFYYHNDGAGTLTYQRETPDVSVDKPRGSTMPYGLISSQTGIGIKSLSVGFTKELDNIPTNYIKLDRSNYKLYYNGSLFNKLGFDFQQLIPFYNNNFIMYSRSHQNRYIKNYNTEYDKYRNMISPITTNGIVSSSNNGGLCSNQSGLPLFLLGNPSNRQSSITQIEDFVESVNLPIKLSYPYLVVKSNIIQNNRSFIDGSGNYTNGIGIIGRQYSSNDFFYSFANDFNYVVDKPYILSNINVGIYTSAGTPAPIDENSSIIFKIIKNKEFFTEEDLLKK